MLLDSERKIVKGIFQRHGSKMTLDQDNFCIYLEDISNWRTCEKIEEYIKKKGDFLTNEEHLEIVKAFWHSKFPSAELPGDLIRKIVMDRNDLKYYYDRIMVGWINANVIEEICNKLDLSEKENFELWSFAEIYGNIIVNRDKDKDSEKLSDHLPIYKIITHKFKFIGRINVLDYGCGPGGYSILALKKSHSKKINAYGVSIRITESHQNVELKELKRGIIPYKDNFFDVVYACYVLKYIKDKDIPFVIKEVLRVLKPSGIFCFNESKRVTVDYFEDVLRDLNIKAHVIREPCMFERYKVFVIVKL